MSEDYDEIFKSDIWRRLRTLTKTSALPEKKTQEKTTMLGRWRRRNSLVETGASSLAVCVYQKLIIPTAMLHSSVEIMLRCRC